ncbi:MAG: hypothetical protein LC107_13600 [Chitinophagales bacterium]|nr:hypothetical protein [Chitinophagales bacterium]
MAKIILFYSQLRSYFSNRWDRIGWISVLMILSTSIYAQKNIVSILSYTDLSDAKPIITITDSVKVAGYINSHLQQLQASGYIFAVADTTICQQDTCYTYLFKGEKYVISAINLTEEQQAIIEASQIKKIPIGKTPDSLTIQGFLKAIVQHQVNHGYPFARASLKQVRFDEANVTASLHVHKGRFITFDSVVLSGKLDMSPAFFSKILDIKSGKYYDHDKVIKAQSKLKNLSYLSLQSAPYVRFINDKASVIIPADPKPASRFDFLIGILPNTVNGVRKWAITGDLIAEMNNAFRSGEYIYFQFKRLQADNLELLIKNNIPYILNLPIGTHLDFRIFKNGNQNLDTYFDGGLQYLYNGNNHVRIFGSYRASSLLDIDLESIKTANKLPAKLDFSYSGLGAGISIDQLNYKFNPTHGFNTSLTTVVGRKHILPNRQIVDLEGFETSYDSLKLQTLQAEFKADFAWYRGIKNWAAIKAGIQAGLVFNEITLRTNELMRIGGNRLLRGFDEESILTDFYGFSTFEFRLILDQNSYMSLPFIDFGYVNIRNENNISSLSPVIGIGLGLNFGTKAGIFNLSFAAGKSSVQPFDFSRMKIHFGYVNLF